jgi:tripartite-type tricarboxylate transporter receptor subunit TctC
VAPSIIDNIPYDTAKDLSAVVALGKNANILVVSPAKGWKTVGDLVAAAKAKPGTVNYGSAGVGTATHISAERFRQSAGFQATHVPYRGGPEALTDIFGGRVDFYYCPISTALPLIREGRLLALATSTPQRASALPDVPTSLEAGYANSDYTVWYGVFMPVKTPRAIVDKFYATTMQVIGTPAMQQKLAELAVDPMPLRPAEFDALVETEIKANERLIKAAGLKPN